jgi:hypothetical protein
MKAHTKLHVAESRVRTCGSPMLFGHGYFLNVRDAAKLIRRKLTPRTRIFSSEMRRRPQRKSAGG